MRKWAAVLVGLVAFVPAGRAHYNMLLPESASARRGQPVTLLYQWGHPFEHQLFDAPAPRSLFVLSPDGKQANLTKKLENGQDRPQRGGDDDADRPGLVVPDGDS